MNKINELWVLSCALNANETGFMKTDQQRIVGFQVESEAYQVADQLDREVPDEPKTQVYKLTFDPPISAVNDGFALVVTKEGAL